MSFLTDLALQRKKLLDALEENQGDINLSIFEDFYPDEAHFIYELLQNAEDAGATEVFFELKPHSCVFQHNGTRHFDEIDIRGITGIFNSSKKEKTDKIGKFGVGFKSVFVYTESPVIYSKHYSFRIQNLVMPIEIPPISDLKDLTRFEFPFDNPKKNVKLAFSEIRNGLELLSETTLLFLRNIQYIRWRVGDETGEVLRDEHSPVHVEVLRQVSGRESICSHWLRFMAPVEDVGQFLAPVEGVERQNVAVAYELCFLPEKVRYEKSLPLSKQLKISPATRGKVSVFFPAEKETSGLRFHLHAPFVPELSRASIKNSSENLPLFEQLGKLTASSLHKIKEYGLLNSDFLGVLPHNDDVLPDRYIGIRSAVLAEMKSKPLVPTYSLSHAPAKSLYQSRAAIKALLSDSDLAFLTDTNGTSTWAVGAAQRNSNADKFLSSLEIDIFESEDLQSFLRDNLVNSDSRYYPRKIEKKVTNWLAGKDDEWHQALYSVLFRHCEVTNSYDEISDAYIVKTANGSYVPGFAVYFPDGPTSLSDHLTRVAPGVVYAGNKKAQQAEAINFLSKIGVRIPGEAEEIYQLLKTRYAYEGNAPSDDVYLSDLKRFIQYSEKNSTSKEKFADACLFKVESREVSWAGARQAFLDVPFVKTGLSSYYKHVSDEKQSLYPLSSWYASCGIELKRIATFAALVGCSTSFESLIIETDTKLNPDRRRLETVPGSIYSSPIDRDYSISKLAWDILRTQDIDYSRLVWKTMCDASIRVLKAVYQKNTTNGAFFAPSQLVVMLSHFPWVPLRGGGFALPRDTRKDDLIEGFTYDASFKWLESVGFGAADQKNRQELVARAQRRTALGFESDEEYDQYLAFKKLPPDRRRLFLEEIKSLDSRLVELPERNLRFPEIRKSRVTAEAHMTGAKTSEIKMRSVQVEAESAKAEAKVYLTDQYTNSSRQMICQACKDELPFKLPNGNYFFEAVEAFADSNKRLRESYLCLCPNHSAAYRYANAQKNSMRELVAVANGTEIEVALGGQELTLYFTRVHLADLQACLNAEEEESA